MEAHSLIEYGVEGDEMIAAAAVVDGEPYDDVVEVDVQEPFVVLEVAALTVKQKAAVENLFVEVVIAKVVFDENEFVAAVAVVEAVVVGVAVVMKQNVVLVKAINGVEFAPVIIM